MSKHQRIADFITNRVLPDPTTRPAPPPTRMTFLEWSKTVALNPRPFIPPDRKVALGITTRLMACVYPWRPIDLAIGPAFASIKLDRPVIRHPDPFGPNGLTDACREFVIDAVLYAVATDGLHRSITWPEPPSEHHGEPA
jgi:hypothetical protein